MSRVKIPCLRLVAPQKESIVFLSGADHYYTVHGFVLMEEQSLLGKEEAEGKRGKGRREEEERKERGRAREEEK